VRSEVTGNAVPGGSAEAAALRRTPVALFLHHGDDDVHVHTAGCCAGSPASAASSRAVILAGGSAAKVAAAGSADRCCCGISATAKTCVSVELAFRDWAAVVNGCARVPKDLRSGTPLTGMGNVSWAGVIHPVSGKSVYRCTAGSGCAADTVMCMHHGGGHFVTEGSSVSTFDAAFGEVMMDAVFGWLARQTSASASSASSSTAA
jgi:hypothetical protein